jgi:hypothetical protein
MTTPTATLATINYGQLLLKGISLYSATLTYTTLTADRTYALPNATGTIALTSDIPTITPSALTKVNDTNVTLTLGGTPSTSLLQGVSLTLGWTGTLADSRITSASNWNTAYTNRITSLTTTGSGAATLIANVLNIPISNTGTVTSIGITVPSAFNVTPSTITSSGTFAITGAGAASQYVRGDGTLANFPTSTGGGASVSYYLNGSVSQGTIGGVAYKEMNGVPVIGAGTDFTINADGYIAQFITDVGDPNKLLIPAGNWNFETYFSASSNGGTPRFYIELYKYDGATFTLIATNSATPEYITGGTSIDLYFTALAIPPTTLLATDRLAVRFYVIHSGRTITMHTENSHLSQIITTFSTGLTALNGLTTQVQSFATGTSGTDFGISSATSTHTFNLPTASATNRGALSTTDWSAFNGKFNLPALTSGSVLFSNGTTIAQDNANLFWDDTNNRLGIGTNAPTYKLELNSTSGGQTAGILVKNTGSGASDYASLNLLNNNGILAQVFNTSNGYTSSPLIGSNGFGHYTNGSGGLTLWADGGIIKFVSGSGAGALGTQKMTLFTTGNLGIGTTTDNGGRLQIKAPGALSTDIALRVRNSADSGDLMLVNGLGNVGIGTAAPGQKLSVNGNFEFQGVTGTTRYLVTNESSTGTGRLLFQAGAGSTAFGGSLMLYANAHATYPGHVAVGLSANTSAKFRVNASSLDGDVDFFVVSYANQNTGIGTSNPVASAKLDITSTTKGFLPPRMTNAQRIAIATPAIGLMVYCTDTIEGLYINKSTGWTFII